jgi:hypothetical protein
MNEGRDARWGLFILLIIGLLAIGGLAWYDGQADARACQDAGYEDYHEDITGGYCYRWIDGHKVLVPFGEIE